MSFTLSQLFPSIDAGLNKIGFLFGAGTSKEAGYPLMDDFTETVVSNLPQPLKETLDEILTAQNPAYDPARGFPNIEILFDLVTERFVTTQDPKYGNLEATIRKLIVDEVLSITDPDLTHHVRFIEALKQRAHGTSTIVTILTTNYDVLFELAAGEVGVRVETGFDGPLLRVFDPAVFNLSRGIMNKGRFTPRSELQINLIKLHGSMSWLKKGTTVAESGLGLHDPAPERVMVLPRRRKVMDTLANPYDQLFTHASRMLGTTCKYLVSCGFSFGDKHINDHLLFPKLGDGKIRMVAMCGEEPYCLDILKRYPSFHAGFPENCYIDRADTGSGTDLWKFSALVNFLEP